MQLLNRIVIILVIVALLFGSINFIQAQNNSQQSFLIGAYMQSSFNQDTAKYSLWRAKHLGINAPIIYTQRAHIDNDPQINYTGSTSDVLPNLNLFEAYENVIAINPLASYKVLDGTHHNTDIRNFDWIYFYSGAYYSKWDATNTYPWSDSLVLRHETGTLKTINGKTYWSSDGAIVNKYLIYGPNYLQETRYRSSKYPNEYNDMQTYKAYFNLSLAQPPLPGHENEPICEISVRSSYTIGSDPTIKYEKLDSVILTRDQIGNSDYQTLKYNYSDYCQNAFLMVKESPQQDCNDKKLIDVEFKVKWLGGQELLIDYVEVYDQDIWEKRLGNPLLQSGARGNIVSYLNRFKDENSSFYNNNLKFFHGVDEPHSVDCYAAHKFIVDVLDSLNSAWSEGAPQLFTHFYPEWYGYRDREKTMPRFIYSVNPKPFHFYYAPYRYNETIETSLEGLRNILQLSTEANKRRDFYFTLDVWDQTSLGWRKPTPSELNAGVMLALSHGAKGIIYEPMYSYITEGPELVGGLWKPEPNQNELFDIGIKVRDEINPRLKSTLGITLLGLNYIGNSLQLQYITPTQNPLPQPQSFDYLTIGSQPSSEDMNWHVGFLKEKDGAKFENNYFLMANLWTNSPKSIQVQVVPPDDAQGYANYRFRNIEPESNFDITFQNQTTQTLTFSAGEGYLFQVAPVVKYGGTIAYNDTIKSNTVLTDNMTINDSKTIIINYEKEYTIQDTITLIGTGFITGDGYLNLTSTGEIIINDWNYSLFKSRNDNHPKLVWGKYPGAYSVSYYSIFRKIGIGNWQFLANTSNRNYTDTYLTIVPPVGQAGTIVYYKIIAVFSNETESQYSNTVEYDCTSKQIEKKAGEEEIIYTYDLAQNYPNPFNPVTTINYSLAEDGDVDLEIVDILGRRIAVLLNEFLTKGNHTINFNATQLPSGVYVYKLQAGDFINSKKMILLK